MGCSLQMNIHGAPLNTSEGERNFTSTRFSCQIEPCNSVTKRCHNIKYFQNKAGNYMYGERRRKQVGIAVTSFATDE